MNERIEKIIDQAYIELNKESPDRFFGQRTIAKKVAELIVKDCARVADRWVEDEDNGHNLVSERLRQHFGVKE